MVDTVQTAAPADSDTQSLWAALRAGGGDGVRARLVDAYLPFARIMAGSLYARRTHMEIEFDDYLQYARVGLMEAVDRYDSTRGYKFETYAGRRITGAILSGMQSFTELQEQIAARKRIVAERLETLHDTAVDAGDPHALFGYLAEMAIGLAVGFALDDTGMYQAQESEYADHTYAAVELKQLCVRVRQLVATLPAKQGQVINYHYLQHKPFEEIAELLKLSRGRISQIHKEALGRLRDALHTQGGLNRTF